MLSWDSADWESRVPEKHALGSFSTSRSELSNRFSRHGRRFIDPDEVVVFPGKIPLPYPAVIFYCRSIRVSNFSRRWRWKCDIWNCGISAWQDSSPRSGVRVACDLSILGKVRILEWVCGVFLHHVCYLPLHGLPLLPLQKIYVLSQVAVPC